MFYACYLFCSCLAPVYILQQISRYFTVSLNIQVRLLPKLHVHGNLYWCHIWLFLRHERHGRLAYLLGRGLVSLLCLDQGHVATSSARRLRAFRCRLFWRHTRIWIIKMQQAELANWAASVWLGLIAIGSEESWGQFKTPSEKDIFCFLIREKERERVEMTSSQPLSRQAKTTSHGSTSCSGSSIRKLLNLSLGWGTICMNRNCWHCLGDTAAKCFYHETLSFGIRLIDWLTYIILTQMSRRLGQKVIEITCHTLVFLK